jgi:tetratricopeptide (TPR) repeat protein
MRLVSDAVEEAGVYGVLAPRRHTWKLAVLGMLVIGPIIVAGGVELGGLAAVKGVERDAQHLRDTGDFPAAIATYRALAGRTGLAYRLAQSQVEAAPAEVERTYLAWARSLASAGQIDEGLVACERVLLAAIVPDARRTRATIALSDAGALAAKGQFDTALHRLDQLAEGQPPEDLAKEATALRPRIGLAAGKSLQKAGRPREAVSAYDSVLATAPTSPEAVEARSLLPGALLSAGILAHDAHDEQTALLILQRTVNDFGNTPEAARARQLLQSPQPVSGTVVHRDGTPVASAQVRLGSDYRKAGTGYLTSPPYYPSRTDAKGNFTIADVPLGAHLIFEVLERDGWTTIVAPTPQGDEAPAYQVTIMPLSPVDLAFVIVP